MNAYARELADDARSTEELVAAALAALDADENPALSVLQARGSEAELAAAARLAASRATQERRLGARILGQLGWGRRTCLAESVRLLRRLLEDREPDVVIEAMYALGHRADESAVPALLPFVAHPDADVRYAAAWALSGMTDARGAIDPLIRLSRDGVVEVRDWATFGLGTMSSLDLPEIREALFDRIADEDPNVRGEALVGLARRGDPRSPALVEAELERVDFGPLVLEAAELLADPALVAPLEKAREELEEEARLELDASFRTALAACRGETRSEGER